MQNYAVAITPDEETAEFDVQLTGPGLDHSGRRFIFRNRDRALKFESTINFVYEQGIREGMRRAHEERDRHWVVAGDVPDQLILRRESLWAALRRRLRL
jgi:hypothetical protein